MSGLDRRSEASRRVARRRKIRRANDVRAAKLAAAGFAPLSIPGWSTFDLFCFFTEADVGMRVLKQRPVNEWDDKPTKTLYAPRWVLQAIQIGHSSTVVKRAKRSRSSLAAFKAVLMLSKPEKTEAPF